jgi:hypothetical protein
LKKQLAASCRVAPAEAAVVARAGLVLKRRDVVHLVVDDESDEIEKR